MSGIESPDMRRLSVDLGRVGYRTASLVRGVVERGALNIKETMRADLRASRHFKRVANDVTYDIVEDDAGVEAVIGPVVGRGAGHAGGLGGIAYFGGANGGGGKVRDPQAALDEEAPKFEAWLEEVVRGAL